MNRYPTFALLPCLAMGLATPAIAQGFHCDFQPSVRELILNTDITQVPTSCGPITVSGGLFVFRNVRIPAGVRVRGEGTRPMILVVAGECVIDGELRLDGRDGANVDTLNSANFPKPGGIGVCGGGRGGAGTPSTTGTDPTGESGFGPGGTPGFGGAGGLLACISAGFHRGSGGGGGSFATEGDPYYKLKNAGASMVQQTGRGGLGGLQRTLAGGVAGPRILGDRNFDNDFFGLGFDLARRRLVPGEVPGLGGGAGGGGGGDETSICPNNPAWIQDRSGAGGGGGGGALLILAGGRIVVGATGRISCNGGNGGGGEEVGTNGAGGGGGGGSGGMVALYSYTHIELHAHGETYANNDYDFAISADGGIGLQGAFAGQPIAGKYPPPPVANFDARSAGGFGGMGVIQLAVPVDGTNLDGTNTIFDDHVHVVRNGVRLTGATKQRYIAWRGYQDRFGVGVDDSGTPTNIGDNEGDLRPSPSLLPLFR